MAAVYQWAEGFRFKADPNAIGAEVEKLSAAVPDGQVTPQSLVDAARRSNGALHGLFEWDDAEAAKHHRIEMARGIIRALIVTVKVTEASEPKNLRAFVNVVKDGQQGYRSLSSAMAEADLRAQVVKRAWDELLSWKRRYSEFNELATACAAVTVAARREGIADNSAAKAA